ncbi:PepSY-associated TM helix domain-containing protein [Paraglaciecola sp.]|uniref:PepSY-associated TM helix domain-containing protein n=1 Tax=Paraglaciecola sp. TaxID=1920173 RepID=UPI0032652E86
MNKKQMLALHNWVGLKLSLLMFIVCLTGTFAVISHELDWLFTDKLRISAQDERYIDWEAIYNNVKVEYPQRSINTINAPLYSNFASIVLTDDPELGFRRVFVDPYTGEVKGELPYYASFQRTLRDLHRYLFAPIGGLYIVGPLGIILLVSTISALLFYKKWWQGFFKLRLRSGSRAFWGSLHKVVGLWSLWFLLLIGITGTWYLAERIIRDAGVQIQQERQYTPKKDIQNNQFIEQQINVSEAIKTAVSTISNLTPTSIAFPKNQTGPIIVTGYTDVILVRPRSNSVFINPVNGNVIEYRATKDLSALSVWVDMADPLHFGTFSGLGVKLVWFFFGLLVCVMSASGIIIFVKRIQKRRKDSWIKNIFGGMKYVTFTVLIIPIFFGTLLALIALNKIAYVEDDYHKPLVTNPSITGLPKVDMFISESENKVFIRLGIDCRNCIAKKHKASVVLENGDSIKFKRTLLKGYRGTSTATLKAEQLSKIKHILLQGDEGDSVTLYMHK